MDLQEINRRLKILDEKKVPVIDKRMLRGGMQERLRRQDIRRYSRDIKKQKVELKKKLDLLETQEDDFKIMSLGIPSVKIEKFNEPKLKRIRSKRSFF